MSISSQLQISSGSGGEVPIWGEDGDPTTNEDLEYDIRKAQQCDLNSFLRAFIYDCLINKCEVDNLEKELTKNETTTEATAQSVDVEGVREKRDKILEEYLQDCLRQVLPLALGDSIQNLLRAYHSSLVEHGSNKYGAYADLCNQSLGELSALNIPGLVQAKSSTSVRRLQHGPMAFTTSDLGDKASLSTLADVTHPNVISLNEWKSTDKTICAFPNISSVIRRSGAECGSIVSGAAPSRKGKLKVDGEHEVRPSKRVKSRSVATNCDLLSASDEESCQGAVHSAAYILEMFSQNMGLHRAISLLHLDDTLCIWYYDRQGIIRSNTINIFLDFPKFLVLLLVFQRFTPDGWGVACFSDPRPPNEKEAIPTFTLQLDSPSLFDYSYKSTDLEPAVKVGYGDEDYLSGKPRSLASRATRVLKATGSLQSSEDIVDLAFKISHPEVRRRHEGEVLVGIRNISRELDEEKMEEHRIENRLPELLFYGDVADTGTRLIRSLVGVETVGHRVMRVIVMKRLMPIYKLDGLQFLCSWLDAVICHAFLWKHGIEHGDPSLNNVMCDPITKRGVLTDFDLSLVQWEPRVIGTERTGTVPFMALDLLCDEYWEGLIKRQYYHELEAFIWILPFVCLDKALQPITKEAMEQWRTGKYQDCYAFKTAFIRKIGNYTQAVPASFKTCFRVAEVFSTQLRDDHLMRELQASRAATHKRQGSLWKVVKSKPSANNSAPDDWSQNLWDTLVDLMDTLSSEVDATDGSSELFKELVLRLQNHQPSFQHMTKEQEDSAKTAFGSAPATRSSVKLRR